MALTIKELLASDTISQAADKINFNFDQLLLNGGGPAGPAGPAGPQGPIGGRGIRGSQWYEDPNPSGSGTDPNLLIFPDLETNDSYLSANGDIWEYNGTVWVNTGINLTGPIGPAASSLWEETGLPIVGGEQIIYPGLFGLDETRTVVVGGSPSSNPPANPVFQLDNSIVLNLNSTISAFGIHVPDSSTSAIRFFGSTLAGEGYTNSLPDTQAINLGPGDSLVFQDAKTPIDSLYDEYGYKLISNNRSGQFSFGRRFELTTNTTVLGGPLTLDSNIVLRISDTGVVGGEIVFDNDTPSNAARLKVGTLDTALSGGTITGNIWGESNNTYFYTDTSFNVTAKGSGNAINLSATLGSINATADVDINFSANNNITATAQNNITATAQNEITATAQNTIAITSITDDINVTAEVDLDLIGKDSIEIRTNQASSDVGGIVMTAGNAPLAIIAPQQDSINIGAKDEINIWSVGNATIRAGLPNSPASLSLATRGFNGVGDISLTLNNNGPVSTFPLTETQILFQDNTMQESFSNTTPTEIPVMRVLSQTATGTVVSRVHIGNSYNDLTYDTGDRKIALTVNTDLDAYTPSPFSVQAENYPVIKVGRGRREGLKQWDATGYYGGGGQIVGPWGSANDNIGTIAGEDYYAVLELSDSFHVRGDLNSSNYNPGNLMLYVPDGPQPNPTGALPKGGTRFGGNVRIYGAGANYLEPGIYTAEDPFPVRSIDPTQFVGKAPDGITIGLNPQLELSLRPNPIVGYPNRDNPYTAGYDNVSLAPVYLYGTGSIGDSSTEGGLPAEDYQSPDINGQWTDGTNNNGASRVYASVNIGDEFRSRNSLKVFGDYVGKHYHSYFDGYWVGPTIEHQEIINGSQSSSGLLYDIWTSGKCEWYPDSNFSFESIGFRYDYTWIKVGKIVSFSGSIRIAPGDEWSQNPAVFASDLLRAEAGDGWGIILSFRIPLPVQLNRGGYSKSKGAPLTNGKGAFPDTIRGTATAMMSYPGDNPKDTTYPPNISYSPRVWGFDDNPASPTFSGAGHNGSVCQGWINGGSDEEPQLYTTTNATNLNSNYMWVNINAMTGFTFQYYNVSSGDVFTYPADQTSGGVDMFPNQLGITTPNNFFYNTRYAFSGTYELAESGSSTPA